MKTGPDRDKLPSDRPRLLKRDDFGNDVELALGDAPVMIGRRSNSDLQILDRNASREHARIVFEDGDYWLEDLGSTHGTSVNDACIDRQRLRHNDRIRLGNAKEEVVFRCQRDDPDETAISIPFKTEAINVTSESLDGYRALLEISRALNDSLRLDDVLDKVIDAVVALTNADSAQLLLGDDSSNLETRVRRGPSTAGESQFSRTVVSEVFATGQPRIAANVAHDTALRELKSIIGDGSVMCVPLRLAGLSEGAPEVDAASMTAPDNLPAAITDVSPSDQRPPIIGVIYVEGKPLRGTFTASDLALFESFAANAAVAIQNARMVTEMVAKRELEQEIEVARKIQTSLLPQEFPVFDWLEIEGTNRPSQQVGGDYFDVVVEDEDLISFAIGDVSGKGVPAALLMSTLQSCFLLVHSIEPDLAKLCGRINEYLVDHTRPEHFATFFVGRIRRSGELTYVSAGHNPPLLFRDGAAQRLEVGGRPLGLLPGSSYVQKDLVLCSGDLLFCYTDGVTEAADASGEEFGEERFTELVASNAGASISRLIETVVTAVDQHSGGEHGYSDDVTLLAIRIP